MGVAPGRRRRRAHRSQRRKDRGRRRLPQDRAQTGRGQFRAHRLAPRHAHATRDSERGRVHRRRANACRAAFQSAIWTIRRDGAVGRRLLQGPRDAVHGRAAGLPSRHEVAGRRADVPSSAPRRQLLAPHHRPGDDRLHDISRWACRSPRTGCSPGCGGHRSRRRRPVDWHPRSAASLDSRDLDAIHRHDAALERTQGHRPLHPEQHLLRLRPHTRAHLRRGGLPRAPRRAHDGAAGAQSAAPRHRGGPRRDVRQDGHLPRVLGGDPERRELRPQRAHFGHHQAEVHGHEKARSQMGEWQTRDHQARDPGGRLRQRRGAQRGGGAVVERRRLQ